MKFKIITFLFITATFSANISLLFSQDDEPAEKTWEEQAAAQKLSKDDIASLKKNRMLITNKAYKQVFSAYLSGETPFFITSDSLLNAYHVLYEESILHLENAMTLKLPGILKHILKNLHSAHNRIKGNPELLKAAEDRAEIVIGTAMKLIDDNFKLKDNRLNSLVEKEVELIVKADEQKMPKWLGKPDNSIITLDYSRYKPRGFYLQSDKLKRYFRAVSWLQSISFRLSSDRELLSILILGKSLTCNKPENMKKSENIDSFFKAYTSFIGNSDDWDITTAAGIAGNILPLDLKGNSLKAIRDTLKKRTENQKPLINDHYRLPPGDPKQVAEPNFRIISSYRTPGSILFQKTTNLRVFNRSFPDGLEIPASLGSSFALKKLVYDDKEKLLKEIDVCRKHFKGESLYLLYLNALEALLDKPDSDAPDFMKNKAWQIKSCNTALAGWAQLRHTWILQAKQVVHYACVSMMPDGFVEPEPAFFSRMALLALKTKNTLKNAGAFKPDFTEIISSMERLNKILKSVRNEDEYDNRLSKIPSEESMTLELPLCMVAENNLTIKKGTELYYQAQSKWLEQLVTDIRRNRLDKYPKIKELINEYHFDIEKLWNSFESISQRLESISNKQLRGATLNQDENWFITTYGISIAKIMFYGGNSYECPTDDAPRIVDIYTNLEQKKHYLNAGIARPRQIYVLYPWQKKIILCAGAVIPYYEFRSSARLTDKEWIKILDSNKRPPVPEWFAPVIKLGILYKYDFIE